MKQIPLTGKHGVGKFALVDDEDYDRLCCHSWFGQINKYSHVWAVSEIKGTKVQMHRFILSETSEQVVIDHKDHNKLNNQKANLRKATVSQNTQNSSSRKGSSSPYLGVHRKTYNKHLPGRLPQTRWIGCIRIFGKNKELGYFPFTPCGEILAAVAYDTAAEKHFGEFANLNFKPL